MVDDLLESKLCLSVCDEFSQSILPMSRHQHENASDLSL
jgi:hypothetical protein